MHLPKQPQGSGGSTAGSTGLQGTSSRQNMYLTLLLFFVFHLLLFGHYVCLELKFERFSLSIMCHGIGCDFNKFDATVPAWHFG